MTEPSKSVQAVQLYRLPPRSRALPMLDGHDCVVALKALGEDTRVRIVGLLIEHPLDVGEIARQLGVSQYNVSKHLRILREAGLVEGQKDGRKHHYALPAAILARAARGGVLDLGCCSFQFDRPADEPRPPDQSARRRTKRTPARAAR